MAKSERARSSTRLRPLKVWDLPTRLFHWVLVALVAGAWYTAEFGPMEWHARIGQAILALVIYRIIWGIIGSETAQFWNFIRGPVTVLRYAKGLFTGLAKEPVGHNPLGACMIVALLLILATQAVFGLMSNDDIFFEGPLFNLVGKEWSDTLTGYHHLLFNVILAAAALHVAAALFYLIFKKENLIGAMITGIKWWPSPLPKLRMTPAWAALPALALGSGAVWVLVTYV